MSTKKPNLFVVGAMKCGTTILSDYLRQHPDIAIGRTKEVHFFSLYNHLGVEWYLDHYSQVSDHRYMVDASPTYFDMALSSSIPMAIKAFNPDAKVIVLLRDPLIRALSHLHHLKTVNNVEALQSLSPTEFFSRDWEKAIVRFDEPDELLFSILNFSAYFAKLSEYTRVFGSESVLVIHNEDLRMHGQECMDRIFDFLGVPRIQSDFFSHQDYVTNSETSQISLDTALKFYKIFGQDYYHSYTSPVFNRLIPASGPSSAPAGAILGDVAVGRDGSLFLVGGSNSPIEFFRNVDGTTDRIVQRWYDVIARRKERLQSTGVQYLHCFIPEKLTVYGDKLGWPINHTESPGYKFFSRAPVELRGSILDIFSYFLNVRDKFKLYYKTDSHWTHIGAFIAYQLICSKLKVEPRNELLQRPVDRGEIFLDLGSKVPRPERELAEFPQFVSDAVLVDESEIVRFKKAANRKDDIGLHVGSMVRYRNETAPHKLKVLLFGDSFSEYRQHLLSGLLAETFSEFIFVWSTSIDYSIVEDFSPDVVLTACTERFMNLVPDDTFNLESYSRRVLSSLAE